MSTFILVLTPLQLPTLNREPVHHHRYQTGWSFLAVTAHFATAVVPISPAPSTTGSSPPARASSVPPLPPLYPPPSAFPLASPWSSVIGVQFQRLLVREHHLPKLAPKEEAHPQSHVGPSRTSGSGLCSAQQSMGALS